MRRKILVLITVLAVALWVVPASADMVQVFLDTPNSAISAFTGPFVEVDITADHSVATFEVTALTGIRISDSAAVTYALMGGRGVFGLSTNGGLTINASTLSASLFSGAGFNAPVLSVDSGSTNFGGMGSYNVVIDNATPGFTGAFHDLSFSTNETFSDAEAVRADLLFNSNAYFMAADIAVALSPISKCEGSLATGNVATSIPPSALLLGSGLLGLVGLSWRRKRN